jgi:hypothetical protein
MICK